jgi:hypothetical protein
MKWENDHLVFETTNRKFFADKFVGITKYDGTTPGLDVVEITQGSSGTIPDFDFTPVERAELADYMISLWQLYKAGKIL